MQGHKIKKKEEMTEIVNARIKRNSSGGWGGNMQNLQYAYLKTSACKLNENALQLYKRRNSFQGFLENWGI